MIYSQPANDLIKQRCSTRSYRNEPISADLLCRIASYLATLNCGPLGTRARFQLIAVTEQERDALRGLGTYGAIKGATGFIVGAVREDGKSLEDYGYLMEHAVLLATDLGLGTSWLGGVTQSSFAKKVSAQTSENLPAVAATGYSASVDGSGHATRTHPGWGNRLPWEELFFQARFGDPLTSELAGTYAVPLEAVRLGPSASNKQPWRIIQDGTTWHFYLQRTKGYRERLVTRLMRVADLQRMDMGVAMCHFELTATELGLPGHWTVAEPALAKPDSLTEYVVSWTGQ